MKICILGSYSNRSDEGMANVSFNLYQFLKLTCDKNEIILLDLNDILKFVFWKKFFSFRADILHFIPGPTLQGIALAKILQKIKRSKLVISATKPDLPGFFKRIAWLFRPDLIIVQSDKSEEMFKAVKYKTIFIPNGVDTNRFVPVERSRKWKLRKDYGLNEKDFIVLHIGPVRRGRNQVELLSQLEDEKILLIPSITNRSEEEAYKELLRISERSNKRVIIWRKYFPNIEDIYALSDVYVFPVFEKLNSIDIPLSVLEAMSCNLPVITTEFGGLTRVLKTGSGLFFIERENQLKGIIANIKEGRINVNTREKIMTFSWNTIVLDLLNIYRSLANY
jgi:glycosyltransferase involved in cell wall biosynthesis